MLIKLIGCLLLFISLDANAQSGDYVPLSETFIPKMSNIRIAMGEKNPESSPQTQAAKPSQAPSRPSSPAQAEPKNLTYLAIKGPNVKGEQRFNKSDVLKTAMDVVIGSGKYQLIFSEPKTFREAGFQFQILRLNIDDQRKPDGQKAYHLKFSVINAKTGKITEFAEEQFVLDRRLLFTTRQLLYQLVYGKDAAKEKLKQLPNFEKPQDEESSEEKPATKEGSETSKKDRVESEERQKELKRKEARRKSPKRKKIRKIPNKSKKVAKLARDPVKEKSPHLRPPKDETPPKSPAMSPSEEGGAKVSKGQNNPPPSARKKAGEKLLRSRKKTAEEEPPKELDRPEADPVYGELKQKKSKGETAEQSKEKEKEDKEEKAIQKEISQFDLRDDPGPGDPPTAAPSAALIKTYKVSFDYIGQKVQSVDRISVTNNFAFMGPKLYARFQFDQEDKDAFSTDFLYTVETQSQEYDVPGLKRLGINYEKDSVFLPLILSAGLRYENQVFVNLPKEGFGLKVSENQILWMVFGGRIEFDAFSRKFEFGAQFFNSFIGSTDFGGDDAAAITIDGTKFVWYADFEIYKNFHLSYSSHTATMQSQGLKNLKNTETSTEVALTYRLGGN